MKNQSPQSAPAASQSPSTSNPASGPNPNPNPHSNHLGKDLREIGDEVIEDLEDAAEKGLGQEVAKLTNPGSGSGTGS